MAQMRNGGEVRYMNNLFAEIAWSSSQVPLCVALVHSICSNSALSSGPRLTLTHTQCLDTERVQLRRIWTTRNPMWRVRRECH